VAMFDKVKSALKDTREYMTPVLTESGFFERGVLTPAEFVKAGDELTYKCPTWRWSAGDPSKKRDHLPSDKQFLIIKNVPCRSRVKDLESNYSSGVDNLVGGGEGDGDWVATQHTESTSTSNDFEDVDVGVGDDDDDEVVEKMTQMAVQPPAPPEDGEDDFVDIDDDFDMDDDDPYAITNTASASAPVEAATTSSSSENKGTDNIVRNRSYNISITYDKYYQTPKVFMFGFDEEGKPLSSEQIFEDVMQDYSKRTVTMENHPHLNEMHASVHPCMHAPVMKQIIDTLVAGGKEPKLEQYLFFFLKFIQSVIPTVDYDFTMAVDLASSSMVARS